MDALDGCRCSPKVLGIIYIYCHACIYGCMYLRVCVLEVCNHVAREESTLSPLAVDMHRWMYRDMADLMYEHPFHDGKVPHLKSDNYRLPDPTYPYFM